MTDRQKRVTEIPVKKRLYPTVKEAEELRQFEKEEYERNHPEQKLEEQVKELRERIAEFEAWRDGIVWASLVSHADDSRATSLICKYYAIADSLLRTVLADLCFDMGVLEGGEILAISLSVPNEPIHSHLARRYGAVAKAQHDRCVSLKKVMEVVK